MVMKSFFKNNWQWLITTIIAVFAIGISVKSCMVAENSIGTSEKALRISQEQFLQINKPFITLSLKKFPNDKYYEINRNENVVSVKLKFKIQNRGNVAAVNIHPPEKVDIPKSMTIPEGGIFKYGLPPKMILGPNEPLLLIAESTVTHETTASAKKFFDDILRGKGITIVLPINYQSEIEADINYRLIRGFQIKSQKYRLIMSELKTCSMKTESSECD